jgi:pimeloyl-ACP methyl ester carboxylesterase
MPCFKHNNLEFYYLDRGSGAPVFFQHGLGAESQKVFDLIELPPGFRLLGMDCRGHGNTAPLGPLEKLRFDSFADDVVELMDHLQIPRAIVGGTSMGAGVALNCALRHSQRVLGLILLRPAWLERPMQRNTMIFALIAKLIREHGPQEGLNIFVKSECYASVIRESSDSADSLRALFWDRRAAETVARLELIPPDTPNPDRSEWRRIQVPTLVLANRCDPIHPFEYGQALAEEIPGARLEELTPKCVDLRQYTCDLRRFTADFLQREFPTSSSSPKTLC